MTLYWLVLQDSIPACAVKAKKNTVQSNFTSKLSHVMSISLIPVATFILQFATICTSKFGAIKAFSLMSVVSLIRKFHWNSVQRKLDLGAVVGRKNCNCGKIHS